MVPDDAENVYGIWLETPRQGTVVAAYLIGADPHWAHLRSVWVDPGDGVVELHEMGLADSSSLGGIEELHCLVYQ
jgi:hypothetical protein